MHFISSFSRECDINVKSMVLCDPLACQVTVPCGVASINASFRAISSKISAAACCVGLAINIFFIKYIIKKVFNPVN